MTRTIFYFTTKKQRNVKNFQSWKKNCRTDSLWWTKWWNMPPYERNNLWFYLWYHYSSWFAYGTANIFRLCFPPPNDEPFFGPSVWIWHMWKCKRLGLFARIVRAPCTCTLKTNHSQKYEKIRQSLFTFQLSSVELPSIWRKNFKILICEILILFFKIKYITVQDPRHV